MKDETAGADALTSLRVSSYAMSDLGRDYEAGSSDRPDPPPRERITDGNRLRELQLLPRSHRFAVSERLTGEWFRR